MLKSSLCDYSDVDILAKGIISVADSTATDADTNNANTRIILKKIVPFTDCLCKINNN